MKPLADVTDLELFSALSDEDVKRLDELACKGTRHQARTYYYVVVAWRRGDLVAEIARNTDLDPSQASTLLKRIRKSGIISKRETRPDSNAGLQASQMKHERVRKQRYAIIKEQLSKQTPLYRVADMIEVKVSTLRQILARMKKDGVSLPNHPELRASANKPDGKIRFYRPSHDGMTIYTNTLRRIYPLVACALYIDQPRERIRLQRPDLKGVPLKNIYAVGTKLLSKDELIALAEETIKNNEENENG